MFSLFKKKTAEEKLRDTYKQLMADAYKLSTSNRRASDAKRAEAEKIAEELERLSQLGL
jgi:hypothetical protein